DYSFTYTIGSMPRLDLKIDKRFSAVDDGVSTYFYIDNVLATTGTLGIIEENNYYPFGLKHRGYNNNVSANVNSVASKFGFQGQETQDELGLNWSSFRWRNADPAIGRFFNIDPLAEEFPHNGVYNFSENRVIDAIELEGLEKVSVHLVMEVTLNNSNTDTNNTFDVIATATLDIGNNNHINYSVALPDLGSTVFGDWSEKNGLSSYAQNSIDHKKYDGILRTGIGIPDFFAEAGLKSAIESFNSERESNESAEDEGVADLVNYLLNSGLQLIESDIMDVFYSYDGSETTGTDENGNKTKRKFTHTYTGRADNLEFTKEGIKFKGTFIVRYTEEETTTEDDD
ncbi:RHS repeat-associated core domain-containing protein, partial [Winogradskyella sp.]|uniref:RHS repeat-associated core domain-containing protein n=1 Tax=Winogradskyella sp. TaxID=1883156 RepID=UPI002607A1E0